MFIAHHTGEGRGLMAGVVEYIELFDETPTEEQLESCAGFQLEQLYDTDTDTDFCGLPMYRTLYHK